MASTWSILAIGLDRYYTIVYPGKSNDPSKKWIALSAIMVIWFSAVIVGLPLLMYSKLEIKEYIPFVTYAMCLEQWPSPNARYDVKVHVLDIII